MARYLLGNQCVIDIAKANGLAPEQWFAALTKRSIDARDVYISAATPMYIDALLDEEEERLNAAGSSTAAVGALRRNCERLVDRLLRTREAAPITKEIADLWATLRKTSDFAQYRAEALLVWATAIKGLDGRPFTLVDKAETIHESLKQFGLALEDPYEQHK